MSQRLGLTLAFALATSQAFAHAHLKTASPAEGATVAAPAEITLGFTEELEVKLSSITVKDARRGRQRGTDRSGSGRPQGIEGPAQAGLAGRLQRRMGCDLDRYPPRHRAVSVHRQALMWTL